MGETIAVIVAGAFSALLETLITFGLDLFDTETPSVANVMKPTIIELQC